MMKTQSVNVPKDTRTLCNDTRTSNPHPRTIHDPRVRDALVTHARSTR
jgi:hypothetical protein